MTENQAYLTLKEAAEYMGISYSLAKRDWAQWVARFKVRTARYLGNPNAPLKFRKADLDRMMDMWSVVA